MRCGRRSHGAASMCAASIGCAVASEAARRPGGVRPCIITVHPSLMLPEETLVSSMIPGKGLKTCAQQTLVPQGAASTYMRMTRVERGARVETSWEMDLIG